MPTIVIDDPSITVVLEDLSEVLVQTLSNGTLPVIDAGGSFSMGGGIISNHGTPVSSGDVTNKAYADGLIPAAIGVSVQAYALVLDNTTASYTTADKAKLDAIATGGVENFTTALKAKLDGIETAATTDQNAAETNYSNTGSGLTATQVQAAIDEIDGVVDTLVAGTLSPTYNNTISGLAAITNKTAIDELAVLPTETITTSSTTDMQKAVTFVNASTDITVTLITAVGNAGKIRHIKRIDTTSNTVTLAAQSGETIDGLASGTLESMDNITLISNGTNWFIL